MNTVICPICHRDVGRFELIHEECERDQLRQHAKAVDGLTRALLRTAKIRNGKAGFDWWRP